MLSFIKVAIGLFNLFFLLLNLFFLLTFNDKLVVRIHLRKDEYQVKPLNMTDLKNEMRELIINGEDPYSVALFGITTHYLLEAQNKIDFSFFELLDDVTMNFLTPEDYDGDAGPFLELLAFYYLLAQNVAGFSQSTNWMPMLTDEQRQTILKWPKNYVLSLFELSIKDETVWHKDMKTGKEYQLAYTPEDLELPMNPRNVRLITILVPTEQGYLSSIPFFVPLDDFTFAKIKRSQGQREYELAILKECYKYRDDQYDEEDWNVEDFTFEDIRFHSAARKAEETDEAFAKRLLEQNPFFQNFPLYSQAENLMIKVIQTFPQLFFKNSDADALLEGIKMLFTMQTFTKSDMSLMSDELCFFWYLLIKEHLPEEVKALTPYNGPEGFSNDTLF